VALPDPLALLRGLLELGLHLRILDVALGEDEVSQVLHLRVAEPHQLLIGERDRRELAFRAVVAARRQIIFIPFDRLAAESAT
jgi:hypothetical protein